MQLILRFRKFIGIATSIAIFLLYFPPPSVHAGMIATDHVIYPNSEQHCDRVRVRAFFERADVMVYLEASGIPCKEVLSRVDSLTDSEIAMIAGRLDQIPEGAESTNYEFDGSLLAIIGLAIYALFMAIAIYFSRTTDNREKTSEKENSSNEQVPERPAEEPEGQKTPSDS